MSGQPLIIDPPWGVPPRGCCVLCHGIVHSPEKLVGHAKIPDLAARTGWRFALPALRWCESIKWPKLHDSDFCDLTAAVEAARIPGKPLVVGGHSMGGYLANEWACVPSHWPCALHGLISYAGKLKSKPSPDRIFPVLIIVNERDWEFNRRAAAELHKTFADADYPAWVVVAGEGEGALQRHNWDSDLANTEVEKFLAGIQVSVT